MQITLKRIGGDNPDLMLESGFFKMRLTEDDAMKMSQALKSVALSERREASITTETATKPAILTLRN